MTETKTCPRCGSPTRSEQGPAGLCAPCLMKMGFDSRSGEANVVFTDADRAPRPPAPSIADLAAHFPELEIRELVAQGGMGCVYRARQKSLERDVALKILTVGEGDPSFAGRFEREARTLAGLSHPNIVSIFEFGQREPWSFLIMEFVEGASLRQMMRAKSVGPRESLAIVTQMCDALQYAHDQGVVHRDIKPENVLVTRDGRVKVLDFGLAKLVRGPQLSNLTEPRQVMGTPHYMAPEQWEKPASVDHRADIYALGVVFYELLTGELPMGRFAPPSHKVAIDVRLDDVVLRTLEKEPALRYQHASEVKDRVTGIAATPGGRDDKPAAGAVDPGVVRRKDLWRVAMIMGAVALGLMLFVIVPLVGFLFLVSPGSDGPPPDSVTMASASDSGSKTTQHVEKDAPSAHVEAGFKDLQIVPELAQRIGLDAKATAALNSALRPFWQDYLRLENEFVTATWLPDGWLDVRSDLPRPEWDGLYGEASLAILDALSHEPDSDRWRSALTNRANRLMRFGQRPEHLAILVDASSSHTRSEEGESDETSSYSFPPDPAYARLWQRMLPTRPQLPK